LGYETIENYEEEKKEEGGVVLLSFLDDDDDDDDDEVEPQQHVDAWMENANRINDGLMQITEILERKKHSYAQPDQTEEASLLESTILSFVAVTANQIEALRQGISSSNRDYIHHCGGIVAYLLATLKEEIANPFAKLQKQRARAAMSLWDNPLQCQLVTRNSSSTKHPLDDDEDERDLRFMPSTPLLVPIEDFMDKYEHTDSFSQDDLKRPGSILARTQHSTPAAAPTKAKPDKKKVQKDQAAPLPYQQQGDDPQQEEEHHNNMLHQEAVLLTATLQNDLDSVQQVEARMTEITSLLAQFSNLVSDQQAEIENIHETTVKSQENVSKGQDHLIDAAERTKQSQHYMATVVFLMAMLLLFFNYITP
jgi:t-SNARE complex subunit (syntaxin)